MLSDNEKFHLDNEFYAEAEKYRRRIVRGQILKGAAKYPTPFNPEEWTLEELLEHAMMENVDQGHYIYGLYVLAQKAQGGSK